jgi:hypothetical protein
MPVAGELPPFVHIGTGVATVNGSAGGLGTVYTITLHSGLSFSGGNNVPETIPLHAPNTATLISVQATGLRVGHTNFSSVFRFNTTQNTSIPPGHMKMCILFPGCNMYYPIPFRWNANNAVGVGGMITVNAFSQGFGFKISLQGAPWTVGVASIRSVTTETPNGAISTYTVTIQGFVHGTPSPSPDKVPISGELQLVTPVRIETNLGAPDTYNAGWFQVTLHVIPEPGMLLLLGSGAAGLLLLGRFRMRD